MEGIQKYPILSQLERGGIAFTLFEHPPIFTVEEGKKLLSHIPGQGTKNLFVTDKKRSKFALITVCEEKRVDLKALGETCGFGRVSFASAEKLKELLNLEPGSVTALGMLHSDAKNVEFFIDQDLLTFNHIQMHPLINSATIVA